MTSVDVAERAGGTVSEDVVRVLPNAVILLDGATTLQPTPRTGGWYAARLAHALENRLDSRAGLAELLAESIVAVTETYDLSPGDAPSSTVALLRWDNDTVETLVLADSPVIVFTAAGEQVVQDERLATVGDQTRHQQRAGYRDRLNAGGGFDDEHLARLAASMETTGRLRNTEGGFWVAEATPEAAWRAETRRFTRAEARGALLASDGVSCGVDQYGIYPNWAAVWEQAISAGAHSVLDTVRHAENSDPDGRRWPRPKRHDDQALAVVHLT